MHSNVELELDCGDSLAGELIYEAPPTTDVRATYAELVAAIGGLVAIAEREAGRDGRAVLPQLAGLLAYHRGRTAEPENSLMLTAGAFRNQLDLLWRLLRRNVAPDRWQAEWQSAERLALDLQRAR